MMILDRFKSGANTLFFFLGISISSAALAQPSVRPFEDGRLAPIQYPAVSGMNVFGGPYIGANQDTLFGGADANIAVPLGDRFGAQFGGTPSFVNGRLSGSLEAHLFARDPAVGMIGLYGSYTGWRGWGGSDLPIPYTDVFDVRSNFFRSGLQAELFAGRWTLSAVGGWKNSGKTPYFFDSRLSFYATDFTKLYAGYEFTDRWLADQRFYLLDTNGALVNSGVYKAPNLHLGKLGAEQMLPFDVSSPLNGTSVYAEAQAGNNGYFSGMAGIRFRSPDVSRLNSMGRTVSINGETKFGGDPGRSLINRDRMDYVLSWLPKDPQKGKYVKQPTYAQAPTPGPSCTVNNGACTTTNAAACCSGICNSTGAGTAGTCGAAAQCTPAGGTCSLNDPGACCSLTCNANNGNPTCAAQCTPAGGSCSLNDPGACCSLTCNANGGNPVCAAQCAPAGAACSLNDPGACCSQTCSANGGNPICL